MVTNIQLKAPAEGVNPRFCWCLAGPHFFLVIGPRFLVIPFDPERYGCE